MKVYLVKICHFWKQKMSLRKWATEHVCFTREVGGQAWGMEKWVGFVGFGRTHGQGMSKFTVRLGNLQKGEKQQEKAGWRGGTLFGLFNTGHHFLCLLGPCFFDSFQSRATPAWTQRVITDTASALYPLGPFRFTCSFDAQLYIPMASCVKNSVCVSLLDMTFT